MLAAQVRKAEADHKEKIRQMHISQANRLEKNNRIRDWERSLKKAAPIL